MPEAMAKKMHSMVYFLWKKQNRKGEYAMSKRTDLKTWWRKDQKAAAPKAQVKPTAEKPKAAEPKAAEPKAEKPTVPPV